MDKYKKIEKLDFVKDEWTPDNNLTTPTLKIKRAKIDERFSEDYENWFKHEESILWE
jgi:long-chain acyl-CoA synthetase